MKKSPEGLHHPIFEVLSNQTRRDILRLIACEHTYGSRLATLLQISVPAVHRHIKLLEQQVSSDIPLILTETRTNESYKGYKGAEAKIYKIGSKIVAFLSIMPTFVHATVYEEILSSDLEEASLEKNLDEEVLKLPAEDASREQHYQAQLNHLKRKISQINDNISLKEQEIIQQLVEKDHLMKKIDAILDHLDLTFEERLVYRSYVCHGREVIEEIKKTIKIDPAVLIAVIKRLKERNLITDLDIDI